MLYKNLFTLIFITLITLTSCTQRTTGREPEVETVNSEATTVAPLDQSESVPATTTLAIEVEPTETESVNDTEQATAAVIPAQPTPLPPATEGKGLQLLVATQDDSLAIWQDGTLDEMANTAGVFSAVFVGDSENNIAYVREHEVWCMDTRTQAAQQVPLPPELVSTIPYEYEAPDDILWLTSLANNSQVMGTVFHATGAYGTILVDCDTNTSQLIESTNPGYPVLAPDGRKIAIAGIKAITVYDLAAGASQVLQVFELIYTYTAAGYFPILSWSSDSTQVITVIHPQDWWIGDVNEPAIVYRLNVENGEVEEVAHINRVLPREPHTPVAYDAKKLAYSIPADPLAAPFGYISTKQMILDLSSGAETVLFEGSSGFLGWNPFFEANSRFSGLTPWNPSGDRVSFWEGTTPFNQKFGVYDLSVGRQLEQRLIGTFAGWISDTSFLYTADGTLYSGAIVDSEIATSTLTTNIEHIYAVRVTP